MSARFSVARLLEMTADSDVSAEELDAQLDDAAMELLATLCSNLAFAVAAARGKSANRAEAHERTAEYVDGIQTVLEVWQDCDAVVVGGACVKDSILTLPLAN